MLFLDKLKELEYAEVERSGLGYEFADIQSRYSDLFVSIIGDATSTEMIYPHGDDTPHVVNVDFSNGDIGLVVFYDLSTGSIIGFSIKI